ncbi:DNA polymerase I [Marinimicrococcus flavescens]|uniref:DNA polymerase I n=1 Tax=Marinimicrococcus flavescens TaxID=3031815 RepID=A0AAP3UZN0_9PROT|nr:DNA polymerase I [Marinimicrococcus flavescens]
MTESTAPTKRLVLVDGSGYIFRAFFALPPMTRPDGTPVNAVFGFTNMLMRLLQDHAQDDIVVVFDAGRKSFRNDLYEAYKANRQEPPAELVPQFALVQEAARAFDLPVVAVEGLEADDLIASYAKAASEAGEEVLVVSSDKDLMQLLREGVSLWDPMKQKSIGPEEVMERFGVAPSMVREALALTGDTSDNVPGVPGIGPKTAAQLLTEFGSLEALLENAHSIKQPKRRETLIANAEKARLSFELVGLKDDCELPLALDACRRKAPDPAKLLAFFQENGFKTLTARIAAVEQAAAEQRQVADQAAEAPRFSAITDMAALDTVLARALDLGRLAIDTETTSLNVVRARLVGISLSVEPGEGFYIPLGHVDDFGQRCQGQLDMAAVLERLRPVLADPSVLKIGHNIKYDIGILARLGVAITPVDDTMLLSYALDGASHGHSMDELASRHLGYETIPYARICGTGKSQITFDQCPVEKATEYAAEDAEVTLRLWRHLRPRLVAERMASVYETLERPLPAILSAMEVAGIRVDAGRLRQLSGTFTQRMARLEEEAHRLAGRPFNLGSPKQLGEVLFDELAIAGAGRKTKTGAYATGAEVLEELAAQGHALPRTVLDWRQLQKLTRTYTDALVEEIVEETGRVHTSYMMASTSTGRLSSTEPNLQNIPIRSEEGRRIREAFVAENGFVLLSADYSQIELRVLAHMAGIEALKQAFANDIDIHAVTASQMFEKPVAEIGPDLRRSAKTINYGIIYGIGAFGLAQRLGIPQAQARAYIEAYFEQYPGIKDYMEQAKAEAREKGFVRTLFGRRCYVPEINARIPSRRAYAERAAINAPIQGSAADIMKRAMHHLATALHAEQAGARMLLQVHDELVLEVPPGEVEATGALVRKVMEGAAELTVPLVVDVGTGGNWDEAH